VVPTSPGNKRGTHAVGIPTTRAESGGGGTNEGTHTVRAIWNGRVIAESADTVVVEGNHYFPRDAVNAGYLRDSDLYSICPWKGKASTTRWKLTGS
jgi:uncharacterized protein (DUF427 family)